MLALSEILAYILKNPSLRFEFQILAFGADWPIRFRSAGISRDQANEDAPARRGQVPSVRCHRRATGDTLPRVPPTFGVNPANSSRMAKLGFTREQSLLIVLAMNITQNWGKFA